MGRTGCGTRPFGWSPLRVTDTVDGNGGYKLDVEEWGYRDVRQELWDELLHEQAEQAGAA